MRTWVARFLLVGLAALPSSAYGQYPAYYYQQPQRYYAPYPYYPQPQYQQWVNQYPQPAMQPMPMPAYVPQGQPTMQPMPAYVPQGIVQVQDRAVAVSPIRNATPMPLILPETASTPSKPPVQPASKPSEPPVQPGSKGWVIPEVLSPSVESTTEATASTPVTNSPLATSTKEPAKEAPAREAIAAPTTMLPATTEFSEAFEGRKKNCQLSVFMDYLYWNVHGADVPYAQAFDGIDPFLSVPRGPVGVVSPAFNTGFRAGGGFSLCEGTWLVATFTYFNTDRDNEIKAPDGLVLHNFLVFPNTVNAAVDSLSAKIDYRIQLKIGDLDYKCAIVNNDHLLLNWSAGVRYANLYQDLVNTFQTTGTTTIDSRITFDGFGPRVGLDGKYGSSCGLFGYANGMVDLLAGQFRGSSEQNNNFGGLIGSTSITSNRIVPILELEIGGGWQSRNGCVRLSAGYYVGSWFNTMTMTGLHSSIGSVNFTTNGNNFRDAVTFDGLVGRVEFRY